ncbi:unnamed protein product [Dovyalis caffra]|uniref:Uncharacterized protein n=1 Tax=Dovyalis caffra TaxID=77055 RepID=A0AAV1RZB6_9ROSI|nr:unnamed protein product [Dovyalis caffra]
MKISSELKGPRRVGWTQRFTNNWSTTALKDAAAAQNIETANREGKTISWVPRRDGWRFVDREKR